MNCVLLTERSQLLPAFMPASHWTRLLPGGSDRFGAQARPTIDHTIEVNVPGHAICCMNTMDHIVGVVRGAILDEVRAFLAADAGRDRSPLPTVLLNFQPPQLMFSMRTDT